MDNPNPSGFYGITPIHKEPQNGHTEIVKILAPLTDNPNAPDDSGSKRILVQIRLSIISF